MSKKVEQAAKTVTDTLEKVIADTKGFTPAELLEVFSLVEDHLDACQDAINEDIKRRKKEG